MPLLCLTSAQLLLVFVVAKILTKLVSNFFFLTWLSKRLTFCRLPTDQELRNLGSTNQDQQKDQDGKKKQNKINQKKHANPGHQVNSGQPFKIRTIDLKRLSLDTTQMDGTLLSLLPGGIDLEWNIDFAIMSCFSCLITHLLFYFYTGTSEVNFSLIWVSMVVIMSLVSLAKITVSYFTLDKSVGERSLCIVSGCIFFLIAMVILIADEKQLDLGLDKALRSLTSSFEEPRQHEPPMNARVATQTLKSKPFMFTKFFIATICSFIGMILTFPGLRFGQLHESLMDRPSTTFLQRSAYNMNYFSNLLVISFWINPLTRDVLAKHEILSEHKFDSLRWVVVLATNLFKLCLAPVYINTFLASSGKYLDQIRKQGMSTTNKSVRFAIFSVNNYVNIVSIQYIIPSLACLFMGVMLVSVKPRVSGGEPVAAQRVDSFMSRLLGDQSSLLIMRQAINGLFSEQVSRGLLGFITWWLHFSYFCTTTAGVIYHKYFTHHTG